MSFTAWLGRLGIVLDFAAFLFAAPELLGDKRLKKIEAVLRTLLNRYLTYPLWQRRVVTSSVVLTTFFILLVFSFYSNQTRVLFGCLITIWVLSFVVMAITGFKKGSKWLDKEAEELDIDNAISRGKHEEPRGAYNLLVIIMLLFPPLAIIELMIEKGLLLLAKRLLPELTQKKGLRRRSLYIAAMLFTAGIIFQIIATFEY